MKPMSFNDAKKKDLAKAKIVDLKSGKTKADLPSDVTPKRSSVDKSPGKVAGEIYPGTQADHDNAMKHGDDGVWLEPNHEAKKQSMKVAKNELQPGMSLNDLKSLEKGALKDAATGVALAATIAAAGTAQNHSKEMMMPLSGHVQMNDQGGMSQEQPDPSKIRMAQAVEKAKSFKQRLADIRGQMKANHKPAEMPTGPAKEE